MRIISQNGVDFPYESIAISYGDGMIYARPISNMDKTYFIAKYSSDEKMEKAMQMLHNTYTGGIWLMKNAEMPESELEKLRDMQRGFIQVIDHEDNVKIETMNMVFRFPQDDEI